VLFATRHRAAGDTSGLSGIRPDVSLVLYMPGSDYAAIARELSENDWPANTLCVLVSSLGQASQSIESCALRELPQVDPLPSPVVMLFRASIDNPEHDELPGG
jgi:uroporphyrin-III C-methyltransferase